MGNASVKMEEIDVVDETVLVKVKKLLALANDKRGNEGEMANMMAKWGGVIIGAAIKSFEEKPFGLIEARKQAAEKAKEFDYRRHAEIVRGIGIQMQNAECEADFKEHYYRLMDECGVLQAGVSKDCPRDFFNRHQIIKGKRLYNTQIKALADSIHYKYKGPAIDEQP